MAKAYGEKHAVYIRKYAHGFVVFCLVLDIHDDVIKWPELRGLSVVNSPHKGQERGALNIFFYLRMNKRLSKQSRRRWLETPSHSLWRHYDDFQFLVRP